MLDEAGTASIGTIELKRIFNGKKVLETVKPSSLIKHLIDLATWEDKDAIILDSFAGSGTTAHAVLDLNNEDDGNLKFILVECEDYADKITAERVRRVIRGIPNSKLKIQKVGAIHESPLQIFLSNPADMHLINHTAQNSEILCSNM